MFSKKTTLNLFLIAFIFMLIGCQSKETAESLYPENEIPVSTTSDEAMKEFVTGLDLYDMGDAQEAKPYFDKALELDPNFVSAQMYRSYTSNSAKEWADNRDKFLDMRDKANEAEAIMMDILEASMQDDTAKEMKLSKMLVEKYPNSARAYDNLAGAYLSMDEVETARNQWKKAMELNPEFTPAISALGSSYLFTSPKDFKEAQKYMEMYVEKAPSNSNAQIGLGDCHRAQNDLQKALACYSKAAELDPEDEVALSKTGHVNTFLGNYEAARQNFRDARAKSEYGTGSYNFEGYTYLYEGDHKKALDFLAEGPKMFDQMNIPKSNKTSAIMGCTYDCAMIAMHYGDADHLNELVEMLKPMSAEISMEVGSKATTAYQEANMHFWDAMASATAGNFEEAASKAEMIKTTLVDMNDPNKLRPYHRVHAFVNYKQGNFEKALEHIAQLDEDYVYDQYWNAKANQMAGNTDEAMKLFEEIAANQFNSVAYALVLNESKEMLASTE